ncbi:perlucin-like protein [Argopecten irradians]|uniref:perlucin-like protein n=1 Tax=Argopecten irradians TaxID=31199 RepID=UPI00371A41F0
MTKFVFVLLVLYLSKASGGCRDGWERFDSNCYLLSQDRTSWSEAASFCSALHSHLAIVTSDDEFNFLKSTIIHRNGQRNQYWIDGTDEEVEGVWRWASIDQKITYFNWGRGQPDQTQHANCLHLWSGSGFQTADGVCETHLNFICQSVYNDETDTMMFG